MTSCRALTELLWNICGNNVEKLWNICGKITEYLRNIWGAYSSLSGKIDHDTTGGSFGVGYQKILDKGLLFGGGYQQLSVSGDSC